MPSLDYWRSGHSPCPKACFARSTSPPIDTQVNGKEGQTLFQETSGHHVKKRSLQTIYLLPH